MARRTEHERHDAGGHYSPTCDECQKDLIAVDWLMAVRKFGLETANEMFPEDINEAKGK